MPVPCAGYLSSLTFFFVCIYLFRRFILSESLLIICTCRVDSSCLRNTLISIYMCIHLVGSPYPRITLISIYLYCGPILPEDHSHKYIYLSCRFVLSENRSHKYMYTHLLGSPYLWITPLR